MDFEKLTRRGFLKGMGGAILGLPLLPSLLGEKEAIAAAESTIRFVFVFTSNGARESNWYPTRIPDADFIPLSPFERYYPLAEIRGDISKTLHSAFDPYRNRMALLRGLDIIPYPFGGHQTTTMLTSFTTDMYRPCIAQILARNIYPSEPVRRSLLCQVKSFQDVGYSLFYEPSAAGEGIPVPPQTDPQAYFDSVFSNGSLSGLPGIDHILEKRSVLDRVLTDFKRILNSPRLSTGDRGALGDHADMIRTLEKRLTEEQTLVCPRPERPLLPTQYSEAEVPSDTAKMIDITVAALKCGLTRVAGIMLTPETDIREYSFLPGGAPGNAHALSHGKSESNNALARISRWQGSQVVSLLDKLSGMPGTTIVYWGNSLGMGWYHELQDFPVALWQLVGEGGPSPFRMGNYVDYRRLAVRRKYLYQGNIIDLPEDRPFLGRPYNQFLEAMLRAGKVTEKQYGGPGFGDYRNNLESQYAEERGVPLPGLEFL